MSLKFYTVDNSYCNFLREIDHRVPKTDKDKGKRPFIGVVFKIEDIWYYAPLSSPKAKHANLKNNVDFIKINGGKWGVINLNNMIPVPFDAVENIIIKANDGDAEEDLKYKSLLRGQLTWCNENADTITEKANTLRENVMSNKIRTEVKERCCDFNLLERRYREYVAKKKGEHK